jgi:1,4-dihydroxy-2-naphthoate octaprenyltransferase
MKKIKFWFQNSRPHALPQSVLPALAAFCMASRSADFSAWLGLMAIVGVALAHSSMNLFDDYFDYKTEKSDFRKRMSHKGFRARILKCHYLTSGKATVNQLLVACLLFGGIAAIFGAVIFYFRGMTVFYIALTALILGIEYSGAPLRLSYRGLGEPVIGIMFGPLSMMGVYFSACGQLDHSALFVSIPVGLLVVNIVYVHSIMDFEPDRAIGKMTLAGLLRKKNLMLAALFVILFAAYSLVIIGITMRYLSVWYLLTLLTLPLAVTLFYLMLRFVKKPEQTFEPKKWYGPMGNWDGFKAAGLGWFMVRWLTARNLLVFFCLTIIAAVLIFQDIKI